MPTAAPGEIIEMPELFSEYSFEAEIPPPSDKLDIDVPAAGSAPPATP